jgi:hypothetical protein
MKKMAAASANKRGRTADTSWTSATRAAEAATELLGSDGFAQLQLLANYLRGLAMVGVVGPAKVDRRGPALKALDEIAMQIADLNRNFKAVEAALRAMPAVDGGQACENFSRVGRGALDAAILAINASDGGKVHPTYRIFDARKGKDAGCHRIGVAGFLRSARKAKGLFAGAKLRDGKEQEERARILEAQLSFEPEKSAKAWTLTFIALGLTAPCQDSDEFEERRKNMKKELVRLKNSGGQTARK